MGMRLGSSKSNKDEDENEEDDDIDNNTQTFVRKKRSRTRKQNKKNERYDEALKKIKSKAFQTFFTMLIKDFEKKSRPGKKDLDPYIKQIIIEFRKFFIVDTKKETNFECLKKTMKQILIDIFTGRYQISKQKTIDSRRLKKYELLKKANKNSEEKEEEYPLKSEEKKEEYPIKSEEKKEEYPLKSEESEGEYQLKSKCNAKVLNIIDKVTSTGTIESYFKSKDSLTLLNKTYMNIIEEFKNSKGYNTYYKTLKEDYSELYVSHYDIIMKNIEKYFSDKKLKTKNLDMSISNDEYDLYLD